MIKTMANTVVYLWSGVVFVVQAIGYRLSKKPWLFGKTPHNICISEQCKPVGTINSR